MRRLVVLLISLAVLATACGSDATGEDATLDQAATSESSEASEPVESADVEAAAPAATASTCNFEAGLAPVDVAVAQIPGDPEFDGPRAVIGWNAEFPEALIDRTRILDGGPPPDGIPPIDDPKFQTAASVDWLRCNEPVLSLVVDGDARAYPLSIMTWHEIVNDTFGDVPVTVSFCPLCNSALVYRRDIDGQIFDFGTSGRLFNSSLIMYDRQSGSLWTHFNGQAVVGSLTGVELERLPVQTTSWENFVRQNPDGLVLTRDTGHRRDYGRNPYRGYDSTADNPFLFDGELDGRLAAKQRVVSIQAGDDSAAIVLEYLTDQQVLPLEIGGRSLSVWHLPGTSSALDTERIPDGRDIGTVGVFIPEVDGQSLTFTRSADGTFADAETGSTWDIGGVAIEGPLAGTRLGQLEHLDTFWFAIAAFEPDTRVIQA